MKSTLTRRAFLQRAGLATGALSAGSMVSFPNVLRAQDPGKKLNCAIIGCGGRSMEHLKWLVTNSKDNIFAIVDPDDKALAKVKRYLSSNGCDPAQTQTFSDYRVMYDKIGKQIDLVVVATPNHHHALAAALAVQLGKAVYCEKPLTHDIAEARNLRRLARESKAPTQMGNQGHCMDGYRRLCEFVEAGVMGKITETHSWTNRANGGVGPRPPTLPVPAGLHWDEWIGPAPFRDYSSDLHPHEWHGWYDFGNGSLGNMGCHVLDGVYWALKVGQPTSIELEEVVGGTDERYPLGSRIRFDVPARGDMPALKAYWYEGLRKDTKLKPTGSTHAAPPEGQCLPPLLVQLNKQYPDETFDSSGTLYVGEKGVFYTATYGENFRLVPFEEMQLLKQPPRTMSRPKNIMTDFLEACRTGRKETEASFEYGAQLTEFTLLGNLAQRAGVGKKVEWDGPGMKVTNLPGLNAMVNHPYRKGWKA